MRICFIGVIVSSLEVVAEESIADLMKTFGKREAKSIGKKLSYNALLGSAVVYYRKPPICFGDPRKCSLCEENNANAGQQMETRIEGEQQNQSHSVEAPPTTVQDARTIDQSPVIQLQEQGDEQNTDAIQSEQSEYHSNTNAQTQEQDQEGAVIREEEQATSKETREIRE